MKKILDKILLKLLSKALNILSLKYSYIALKKLFDKIENVEECYLTYHKRPKYAETIKLQEDFDIDSNNIYIVMQGPIVKQDDFTIQTIKLYKQYFNNIKIILSTWDDEDIDYINCNKIFDILILNKKPFNAGYRNINMQILSTRAGVRKACEEGAHFILRTRTDQRIYNPNSLIYFQSLLSIFSKSNISEVDRIIIIGGTLKYRPFGASDMLMFGYSKDIYRYWNIDLDERTGISQKKGNTIYETAEKRVCETYLCTEYLSNLNFKYNINLKDTWEAYVNYFIIVDNSTVDFFWLKYERRIEYRFSYYNSRNSYQLAKETDWLPRLVFHNYNIEYDLNIIEGGSEITQNNFKNK